MVVYPEVNWAIRRIRVCPLAGATPIMSISAAIA